MFRKNLQGNIHLQSNQTHSRNRKNLLVFQKILQHQIALVILSRVPFGMHGIIQYLQMMIKWHNTPHLVFHLKVHHWNQEQKYYVQESHVEPIKQILKTNMTYIKEHVQMVHPLLKELTLPAPTHLWQAPNHLESSSQMNLEKV